MEAQAHVIDTEAHLRAWYTTTVRLDLHLRERHGIAVPSNRQDWATLHAFRHWEHDDHSLIVPPRDNEAVRAYVDSQPTDEGFRHLWDEQGRAVKRWRHRNDCPLHGR